MKIKIIDEYKNLESIKDIEFKNFGEIISFFSLQNSFIGFCKRYLDSILKCLLSDSDIVNEKNFDLLKDVLSNFEKENYLKNIPKNKTTDNYYKIPPLKAISTEWDKKYRIFSRKRGWGFKINNEWNCDYMDKYEFEQLINNDPKYIHLDYTILFNDFWEEEFVIRNFCFFDSYIFLTRSKFEWTLDIFRKLPNLDVRLIQLNKSILWDIDSLTEFECRLFFGKINKIYQNRHFGGNSPSGWADIHSREYPNIPEWQIQDKSLSSANNVLWSLKLIEKFKDNWNWKYLSINSSLKFTIELIETFKSYWDWTQLSQNEAIEWSDELLYQFKGYWNWFYLSKNPNLPWCEELVERYEDKWNWNGGIEYKFESKKIFEFRSESLSSNPNIVWTKNLINKYRDRLNFASICWEGKLELNCLEDVFDKLDCNNFSTGSFIRGSDGSYTYTKYSSGWDYLIKNPTFNLSKSFVILLLNYTYDKFEEQKIHELSEISPWSNKESPIEKFSHVPIIDADFEFIQKYEFDLYEIFLKDKINLSIYEKAIKPNILNIGIVEFLKQVLA